MSRKSIKDYYKSESEKWNKVSKRENFWEFILENPLKYNTPTKYLILPESVLESIKKGMSKEEFEKLKKELKENSKEFEKYQKELKKK